MSETHLAAEVLHRLAEAINSPLGLLYQLLAAGWVLGAVVLYPLRRLPWHPDVINGCGAFAGLVAWIVIEARALTRTCTPVDAIAELAPVIAIPGIGTFFGRFWWLFVAGRNEDRRPSLVKWEYKTVASGGMLVTFVAVSAAPFASFTVKCVAAVIAAILMMRGLHLLRAARRGRAERRLERPETEGDEEAIAFDHPDGAPGVVADVSRSDVELTSLTAVRVLLGVVRRKNPRPMGATAVDGPLLARVRAAGAAVSGVAAVGEPLAVADGWRLVLPAVPEPTLTACRARRALEDCAEAATEAAPGLAEVIVCLEDSS